MTPAGFTITKTTVTAKSRTLSATWTMTPREKIKPKFCYEQGHPAGYTDDLGIIADRNQWTPAKPSGWWSAIDRQDYFEMEAWCNENLKGRFQIGMYHIIISAEEDVAWFLLRWG